MRLPLFHYNYVLLFCKQWILFFSMNASKQRYMGICRRVILLTNIVYENRQGGYLKATVNYLLSQACLHQYDSTIPVAVWFDAACHYREAKSGR